MSAFNAVKVFAATKVAQRQTIGEEVTRWLEEKRQQPGFQLVDVVVRQSSDEAFHCISICVFYKESTEKKRRG